MQLLFTWKTIYFMEKENKGVASTAYLAKKYGFSRPTFLKKVKSLGIKPILDASPFLWMLCDFEGVSIKQKRAGRPKGSKNK